MAVLKTPKIVKVYEALSAVGAGRVRIEAPDRAKVTSSDGSKEYAVHWREDWSAATANDNLTRWQSQIGYPIIAAMLLTGKLTYSSEVATALADVAWKRLNDELKRDYDLAIETVLKEIESKTGGRASIQAEAERLHAALHAIRLARL